MKRVEIKTAQVAAVLLNLIECGELKSLPLPCEGDHQIGDLLCLEVDPEFYDLVSVNYVYVQVVWVSPYFPGSTSLAVPGYRLVTFRYLECLNDVVIE